MRRALESTPRLLLAFVPVDVKEPLVDIRVIVSDHLQIAAEKGVISDVKTDDGSVAARLASVHAMKHRVRNRTV